MAKTHRTPHAIDCGVRLFPDHPEPDADGRYCFCVGIHNVGVPGFHICAKSSAEAKKTLGYYILNMLEGAEDIIADD